MSDLADKIREQATITGKMIIKADSRTGSTHMTDREEWGRLMAEQLSAPSREVVLGLVEAEIVRTMLQEWIAAPVHAWPVSVLDPAHPYPEDWARELVAYRNKRIVEIQRNGIKAALGGPSAR